MVSKITGLWAATAPLRACPHQGQVTMPRLLALLHSFGILISKRQLVRLLIAGQDGFLDEARDVLRAGLASAAWITFDDTGARHQAANGFCTQMGNTHFAWLAPLNRRAAATSSTAAHRPWRCH
jgi:hypothetical protein